MLEVSIPLHSLFKELHLSTEKSSSWDAANQSYSIFLVKPPEIQSSLNPFRVGFFFVNLGATTKLNVLSEIFIKVLSNHIFLELHIVT